MRKTVVLFTLALFLLMVMITEVSSLPDKQDGIYGIAPDPDACIYGYATYQTTTYSVVGDYFRYYDDTVYTSIFEDAVDTWNDMGYVDISRVYTLSLAHVRVYDYYDDVYPYSVGEYGYNAYSQDNIRFNTYFYADMNTAERTKTALHELGHSLGIHEQNLESTTNVMHQGIRENTTLGPCDQAVYYANWG